MSENKTKATNASVSDFIENLDNLSRKADSQQLLELMGRVTDMQPRIWGTNIVGYGEYHYKYHSGREGDFFLTGFAPRKTAMTIYVIPGFKAYTNHLARLGPHRHTSSCLYITRLARIDMTVLEEIIAESLAHMKLTYPWKP